MRECSNACTHAFRWTHAAHTHFITHTRPSLSAAPPLLSSLARFLQLLLVSPSHPVASPTLPRTPPPAHSLTHHRSLGRSKSPGRTQVQSAALHGHKYSGVLTALLTIYREEGFRGWCDAPARVKAPAETTAVFTPACHSGVFTTASSHRRFRTEMTAV
eukprot:6179655-Pleurochrysis_carterae.AAC.3